MRTVVLGSAAGGGFPQWNSNGPGCRRARAGDPLAKRRTQTSLAVTADDKRWFLLNAAPDLREQIAATPALWPREGVRSSPVIGVALANADVDAVAGLLHMRERQPFTLYATAPVLAVLAANSVFDVLLREHVARCQVPLGRTVPLLGAGEEASGLVLEAFPVPGKVPLYLEHQETQPGAISEEGAAIGMRISAPASGGSFFFIPGCAAMTPRLAERLDGAALVFFDGTLWTDDEMIRSGAGDKTGRRMGHMSIAGPEGAMAAFAGLDVARKILIHANNTNPVLLEDSPERATAAAAGWEVAHDGMEITL